MIYLLLVVLLFPPLLYFALAIFVCNFALGGFFALGLVGAFIIGVSLYKKIQAMLWKDETKSFSTLFITGVAITGISVWLMARETVDDAAAAMWVVMRMVFIAVLTLCYVTFYRHRKRFKRSQLIFVSMLLVLVCALGVTAFWLPAMLPIYRYSYLLMAIVAAVLNAINIIKINLHFHNKPFVLFEKIKGWNKYSNIFSDVLFILLPLLMAVVQLC